MSFEYEADTMRAAHPLPDHLEDVEMNRTQIASAFGRSENTIDSWRKSGMPVLREGGNGQSYAFQLSDCWAWYHAWKASEDAARKKADAIAEQTRLEFMGDDADSVETFKGMKSGEIEEMLRLEQIFNATEEGRRQRVLRNAVIDLMSTVFLLVRDHMESQPDVLEREAALTPAQVDAAIASNDRFLTDLKKRIEGHEIFLDISASISLETSNPSYTTVQ